MHLNTQKNALKRKKDKKRNGNFSYWIKPLVCEKYE
jgi:hypothetical protein